MAEGRSCGVSKEIFKAKTGLHGHPICFFVCLFVCLFVFFFVVASHYQSLEIIVLLLQACALRIVAATIAVATTGPSVSTLHEKIGVRSKLHNMVT